MQKYIGSDVTSMVTLPVLIFEPMSMLQKMVEVCVYISNFIAVKILLYLVLFCLWEFIDLIVRDS